MICSHDSYTFQKASNIFINIFKIFWKCQKLNIDKQYQAGVRIFDVRVCSYKKNNSIKWRTAHGAAKFSIKFDSISSIFELFSEKYPESIIRVYLEDKDANDIEVRSKFKLECDEAFKSYKDMIWEIGTHYPWTTTHVGKKFTIKEYYCHLLNWNPDRSFKDNLKLIDWSSWNLVSWAKKHNPVITKDMIDDENTMHILDYVGIYPKQI